MARPAWSVTEAIERTGVSRSTLRRQLDAGKFPNAYKESATGAWRIPLEDLLAAGLSVSVPATEQAMSAVSEQATTATNEQVSKLEQALAVERARADNAERLAASYQENVQDLRRALLMLGAGTGQPEQATEPPMNTVTEQALEPVIEPMVNNPETASLDTTKGRPLNPPLWRRFLTRR